MTCSDCKKEFSAKYARYCPDCRWRHRGKPAKYIWTVERDQYMREHYDPKIRGRAQEIAGRFGWQKWVITHRAARLGLAADWGRKPWSADEEQFLINAAGSRHIHWIAKQLGRSDASIALKMKHLEIRSAVREGYTLRELELCFGTDHHVIERWVREGKLKIDKRGTERTHTGDIWAVTDTAILEFISAYPLTFRLDKVDQTWFMDLITNGALIRKALEAARKDAA
jgi:hypothetical protein